jgi:CspA family cold shock protein
MSTITPAFGHADAAVVNGIDGNAPAATCSGTVKWFDSKKGFGFILSPEGKDVFVHFSCIEGDGFRALRDGERVSYEQVQGAKGLLARRVRRGEASPRGD